MTKDPQPELTSSATDAMDKAGRESTTNPVKNAAQNNSFSDASDVMDKNRRELATNPADPKAQRNFYAKAGPREKRDKSIKTQIRKDRNPMGL